MFFKSENALFFLIFHSIYDYYILAGGFNSTRIVENVRDGLIQDGQQIHVFMTSTTHGDTLYPKLTLSLKLKKDLVFGASHRIYILKLSICAFTTHLWRCMYIFRTLNLIILRSYLHLLLQFMDSRNRTTMILIIPRRIVQNLLLMEEKKYASSI